VFPTTQSAQGSASSLARERRSDQDVESADLTVDEIGRRGSKRTPFALGGASAQALRVATFQAWGA
jgi:hypothetical protein